ncbi:MAG: cbb3-type cytochrome c oxidase N-terminal domain-containing protein [Flavobacteriales bacterium]
MIKYSSSTQRCKRLLAAMAAAFLLPITTPTLMAQSATAATSELITNVTFITLLTIIIVLLFVIVSLSSTLKNIADSGRKKGNSSLAIILVGLSMSVTKNSVIAQSTNTSSAVDAGIAGMDTYLFYTMIAVIVVEFLIILVLVSSVKDLLKGLGYVATVEEKPKPIININWTWMNKKLTDAVPVEREAEVMTDHEYDGIKELDNNLPPWWKYMFYFTISFSVVYIFHFHVLRTGPSQEQEYQAQMAEGERLKQEYIKFAAANVDENTVVFVNEASALANGKKIFMDNNCSSCHGEKGEGNSIGPNLTDDYWLHGGSVRDIFKSIKYGIPAKGMIAWQSVLKPNEIQDLASYIYSLRGSNPPNAKAPQGEKWVEETTSADALSEEAKNEGTEI